MGKHGKNYIEARMQIDRSVHYNPEEALKMVKELAYASFDETVEFVANLGVNPRHADQQVRGTVALPHGTGKEVKILVFAKGEKAMEAEESNADIVGAEDLIEKIQGGWLDFDVAVATPDIMSMVGKIGKILGPRGLMPNPKAGTVTHDVGKAIKEIKAGKVEYRVDKAGVIHVPVGKTSFSVEKLVDNFNTVLNALLKARPATAKGQYIKGITVSSTMGPGVKVSSQKVAVS